MASTASADKLKTTLTPYLCGKLGVDATATPAKCVVTISAARLRRMLKASTSRQLSSTSYNVKVVAAVPKATEAAIDTAVAQYKTDLGKTSLAAEMDAQLQLAVWSEMDGQLN